MNDPYRILFQRLTVIEIILMQLMVWLDMCIVATTVINKKTPVDKDVANAVAVAGLIVIIAINIAFIAGLPETIKMWLAKLKESATNRTNDKPEVITEKTLEREQRIKPVLNSENPDIVTVLTRILASIGILGLIVMIGVALLHNLCKFL